ncbi:putative glucan endo-1,3-beta-glucosidase [Lachnellula hyalina]|uniref:glucan endo-1,3-beta-D-glucosidase n=1 Tax=Lachnellula hyalina TaxID=1316788 RepID=A0A8H8R6I5_9HELO|nr:putative glucan endo-1,3-beta-glucosidase [Lachnellula hyalina]TVY28521.1 putative glucan endo-1,3-beta-glucosidase [Lachnellula hyalina]
MSRRYSFEEDLPQPYSHSLSPQHTQPYDPPPQQPPSQLYDPPLHPQPPQPYDPPPYDQILPSFNPATHPESAFNRLRAERRYSREGTAPVPAPPPHRDTEGRSRGRELGFTNSGVSNVTPGVDNFGEQAAGGLTGIAMSVADHNARESGLEALRNTPGYDGQRDMYPYDDYQHQRPPPRQEQSSSSLAPLGAAAFPPGMATPQSRSTISRSPPQSYHEPYADTPYRYSRNLDPSMTDFDPSTIEDDGDDGLEYRQPNRGSMMNLASNSDRNVPAGAAVAGGAAAGGILGSLGGVVGKSGAKGTQYNPVAGAGNYNMGEEKGSEWLKKQSPGNSKRKRWTIIILVGLAIAAAIVGGTVGGVLGNQRRTNKANSDSSQSASDDTKDNGVLDKDSDDIKALMNNKDLHKVFPGMDYTPMYTQYPDCLTYPASQNNVTRDVAVLSQLTNTIRLYGTDCNQTELVLESIDKLGLNDQIKVWMGVWQDTNKTTNARQLQQMYDIFDKYGADQFIGVIVGNEILFRKDMNITELGTLITDVRTNLTAKNIKLPIAAADLGDNWTAAFAAQVDYLMANIHPFFAGTDSKAAAAWTWNFWQEKDVVLKTDLTKNIISETGWPSTGGTDCGEATTCPGAGSVAGISQMNDFMDGWVCDALANGTNYFWFEAFDEPWKFKFNTAGKGWEDQWGLMDVNRNLKPGVTIPDCGGKVVS